ncbi:SRPBCC domain-containing protein [Effusibacillus consociatus]|uniref:SRPBCC domain-containing protein n=1 Tax=Effusibacillus consociatus TaxID=1117041 RepID=A0ABV9PZK3_9BACL
MSKQIELVITRTFDAPRELVFKAFTQSEHLQHWWGPKGFTMNVAKLDLRPGGIFQYSMRSPEGHEMWGKFVYREIAEPEKLVYVSSFSDAEGNTVRAPFSSISSTWPLEVLNMLTFTEHEGKTTLTMRGGPINATEEEIKTFESMLESMQQGFAGTFDQLADYLAMVIDSYANNKSRKGGITMIEDTQEVFEQQRQDLLKYNDQLSKSMRPDEAEMKGHHLAATVDEKFDIQKGDFDSGSY